MRPETNIGIVKKSRIGQIPPEVKAQIVSEIEAGQMSIKEAMSKFEIYQDSTIKGWIKIYGKSGKVPTIIKRFSEAERRQIMIEFQSGKLTAIEIIRKYGMCQGTLNLWRRKYSDKIAIPNSEDSMKKNESHAEANLNDAQLIEQLKLKVAALETMIDIAEEEFNIEIRKKSGSKQ